jgi:hypothetical protein
MSATKQQVIKIHSISEQNKPNGKSNAQTAPFVSSQQLLQEMADSKHAPGIRRLGCPCCEPDSAATYADNMML